MTELTFNNANNTITWYNLFEFNYKNHFLVLFEENINNDLKSDFTNKLARKLKNW